MPAKPVEYVLLDLEPELPPTRPRGRNLSHTSIMQQTTTKQKRQKKTTQKITTKHTTAQLQQ